MLGEHHENIVASVKIALILLLNISIDATSVDLYSKISLTFLSIIYIIWKWRKDYKDGNKSN